MLIGSTNAVQAAPSSDIALAQQAGQSFIAQRTQIFPDWPVLHYPTSDLL